jgi:hypothetical protein
MRRAIFLALSALLIGALPAGAARPGIGMGAGQNAEAFWVDFDAKSFYFAEGFRMAAPGLPTSYVAVGKGTCTVKRFGKHGMMVSCMARAVMKEATVQEFFIDPTLKSARIDVEMQKQHHVVDWTADEMPSLDWNGGAATYGAEANASLGVLAHATGTLFGQKLETSSFEDFAFLVECGGVFVSSDARDDGTVQVRISFPASLLSS